MFLSGDASNSNLYSFISMPKGRPKPDDRKYFSVDILIRIIIGHLLFQEVKGVPAKSGS